jgi:hypothetical protein
VNDSFKIYAPGWFGWQMNPGYFGERCVPYFTPIHVTRVAPQDGVGCALFKSVKFQFLASEDDFVTFRPVYQFVSQFADCHLKGSVNSRTSTRETLERIFRLLKPTTMEVLPRSQVGIAMID